MRSQFSRKQVERAAFVFSVWPFPIGAAAGVDLSAWFVPLMTQEPIARVRDRDAQSILSSRSRPLSSRFLLWQPERSEKLAHKCGELANNLSATVTGAR